LAIGEVIQGLLKGRKFEFDVERAIFLTVLHRLFVSGSDRFCEKWRRGYGIQGVEGLSLHHLYRAMSFLGEEIEDQRGATSFTARRTKDLIEEGMFFERRDLVTALDLVFFDTTSIYFEGQGGEGLGAKGHSEDHRPDRNQMVVGVALDNRGKPVCCEMWPGNTTDVKSLIPVTDRIRSRFGVGRFCVVADRGMISADTLRELQDPARNIRYILGARMRKVTEIKREVLSHPGRYREVRPESRVQKDPSPLRVKEVVLEGKRYIVCLNPRQAREDAQDRQAIVASLRDKLKSNPKGLIGNKGYRRYLKMDKESVRIDQDKIEYESRFDGKWVLTTNTDLSARLWGLRSRPRFASYDP
jgi:hypothetical protein